MAFQSQLSRFISFGKFLLNIFSIWLTCWSTYTRVYTVIELKFQFNYWNLLVLKLFWIKISKCFPHYFLLLWKVRKHVLTSCRDVAEITSCPLVRRWNVQIRRQHARAGAQLSNDIFKGVFTLTISICGFLIEVRIHF